MKYRALLEAAERAEKAAEAEQRQTIEGAASQLALRQLWPPNADPLTASRFFMLLNAAGFIDAAAMLVPVGLSYEVRRSGTGDQGQATIWDPMCIPGNRDWRVTGCASPALALCAAALYAHAAQGIVTEGGDGLPAPVSEAN